MHHKLYHRPGPNTEPQTAGFVRPILAHAMTYQLSHKGGLLQGHPLPTPAKFSRHLFPHSSVILFTEWQTERSYDLRLVGGGNYIALRGSKPLPMCQPQPEVIRDSNSDLVNSLSSSVISLSVVKRGWWLVNVWEMLINLLKSPILQWWGKWKSDLESVSGTGSSPAVNQVLPIDRSNHNTKLQWSQLITFAVILTDRQTDRQTYNQTNWTN